MPEHNTIRSTSPLHFLYPHLNLSTPQSYYSYSSSTSTPRSKAAKQKSRRTPDHDDISRLLDPSYLPSSSSSAGVYVDPSGEVHDPDYRHFPLVTIPSNTGSHKHGHHHHTHNSNPHYHNNTVRRHSGTRGRTSPRPHFDWELAVDESVLDDEYPPEEEEHVQNHRYGYGGYAGGMSSASSRRSGSSSNPNSPVIIRRPRDSSFSTATTAPTWYPSPTMTDSTLPTSYELGDTFEEEKEKEAVGKKEEKKKRRRLSKGDKEKMTSKAPDEEKHTSATTGARTSLDEGSAHHYNGDTREEEDEDEAILARHQEYVPTCSQSLRRSWQAFALRFRFGLFRAQRRMTRRVHSLL